ncbi:MAG: tetratricopeptide repeat protein, partial [Planctomycetota bacterium]
MSAIVYSFAVESGLPQVPGTAPLAVLSRQIPRQVVLGLNQGRDRGLRFFPFMGQVEGVRRFFELPEPLAIPELLKLHGQSPAPAWIVDGWIHSEGMRLRIADGESGEVRLEEELPFDPEDPWAAVQRIQFELLGCMGWSDLPPKAPDIQGDAAGWFLIARDDLLALEANHLRSDPGRSLRAVAEAFARSPHTGEVRELLLDISQRMAQQKIATEAVTALLLEVAPAVGVSDPAFVDQAASIVESVSGMAAALPLYEVQADCEPAGEASVKAGMVLFQHGERERSLSMLRRAFDAGNSSPSLRAQLAVVEGECGDSVRSSQLLDELAEESALTSAITRLVTNYLLLNERNKKSLELLDGALSRDGANPGLHLDRGRALLAMRRGKEAAAAFKSCLESRPNRETREEVRRYLSL